MAAEVNTNLTDLGDLHRQDFQARRESMAPKERQGTAALLRELAAFLLFGGLAALANLAMGWQLYGRGLFPNLPYWCATGLAAACGLVVNFGLNYVFNFKFHGRSALRQFSTFCVVALIGVAITSGLSYGIMLLLVAWAGPMLHFGGLTVSSAFAAHFTAVGLTVLYSFPAHKFLSFNIGIRAQAERVHAQVSGTQKSFFEQV